VLTADRKDAPRVLTEASNWDDDLHVLPASPLLESAERELIGVSGTPYRLADPLSRIAHQSAAIVNDKCRIRPAGGRARRIAMFSADVARSAS
jgi:chromosome partitioning protein